MSDNPTTLPGPSWLRGPRRGDDAEPLPALVVAWSADEPGRVGEVALFAAGDVVLGRGRHPFRRQRPGSSLETGPLTSGRVSREQLRLRAGDDELSVENVGRGELLVNGVVAQRATLRPGDTIALRHTLVLYVTRRPPVLPPRRSFPSHLVPPFGAADVHGLVGESDAAWRLREDVAFVAGTSAHVLILGESGTGKELVARAVHALSARAPRPLVARNAATLPEGLIDAELFGNVKDYPNPGMRERPGIIGEASGSTLFLDEIGELPAELQAHLLRVLDGGEYHRLGEARSRVADLRLVAATNRDPSELKHDLRARLALTIDVPGLGDRREDLPLLVRHLVHGMVAESPSLGRFLAGEEPRVHPDVIEHLLRRAFTHHVRELNAFLWRAIQASDGDHIAVPAEVAGPAPPRPAVGEPTREGIVAALERSDGNVSVAFRELGLPSRYALHRLMKKHDIKR